MAKRDRATKKQIETMVSFIEQNKEMAYTLVKSPDEQKKIETKWEELKALLNSQEGPKRTAKQWKSAFADLKTNIRRRARSIKKDVEGTGGGPSINKPLTEIENRILSLINPVVIEGVNVLEPGLINDMQETVIEEGLYEVENVEIVLEDSMETTAPVVQLMPPDITVASSSTASKEIPRGVHKKPLRFRNSKRALNNINIESLINSNNNIASALNNVAGAIRLLARKHTFLK